MSCGKRWYHVFVNWSWRSIVIVRLTFSSKYLDGVADAETELIRRNYGDVSREIAGTVEQNKLLGLGTINNVAFSLCTGSLAKTLPVHARKGKKFMKKVSMQVSDELVRSIPHRHGNKGQSSILNVP